MPIKIVGTNARGTIYQSSPLTLTMGQTPTQGNVIILVFCSINNSGFATISSITQTGVTWTGLSNPQVTEQSSNVDVEIWIGQVGASAGTGISVAISTPPFYGAIADAVEFSGIATSSFKDVTSTATGQANPTATGTTATTAKGLELWIGAINVNSNSTGTTQSSPGNSFTLLDGAEYIPAASVFQSFVFLYKIVSATAAASSSTTTTAAYTYNGCICTFIGAITSKTLTANLRGYTTRYRKCKAVRKLTANLRGYSTRYRQVKAWHRLPKFTEIAMDVTAIKERKIIRLMSTLISMDIQSVTKVSGHVTWTRLPKLTLVSYDAQYFRKPWHRLPTTTEALTDPFPSGMFRTMIRKRSTSSTLAMTDATYKRRATIRTLLSTEVITTRLIKKIPWRRSLTATEVETTSQYRKMARVRSLSATLVETTTFYRKMIRQRSLLATLVETTTLVKNRPWHRSLSATEVMMTTRIKKIPWRRSLTATEVEMTTQYRKMSRLRNLSATLVITTYYHFPIRKLRLGSQLVITTKATATKGGIHVWTRSFSSMLVMFTQLYRRRQWYARPLSTEVITTQLYRRRPWYARPLSTEVITTQSYKRRVVIRSLTSTEVIMTALYRKMVRPRTLSAMLVETTTFVKARPWHRLLSATEVEMTTFYRTRKFVRSLQAMEVIMTRIYRTRRFVRGLSAMLVETTVISIRSVKFRSRTVSSMLVITTAINFGGAVKHYYARTIRSTLVMMSPLLVRQIIACSERGGDTTLATYLKYLMNGWSIAKCHEQKGS